MGSCYDKLAKGSIPQPPSPPQPHRPSLCVQVLVVFAAHLSHPSATPYNHCLCRQKTCNAAPKQQNTASYLHLGRKNAAIRTIFHNFANEPPYMPHKRNPPSDGQRFPIQLRPTSYNGDLTELSNNLACAMKADCYQRNHKQ